MANSKKDTSSMQDQENNISSSDGNNFFYNLVQQSPCFKNKWLLYPLFVMSYLLLVTSCLLCIIFVMQSFFSLNLVDFSTDVFLDKIIICLILSVAIVGTVSGIDGGANDIKLWEDQVLDIIQKIVGEKNKIYLKPAKTVVSFYPSEDFKRGTKFMQVFRNEKGMHIHSKTEDKYYDLGSDIGNIDNNKTYITEIKKAYDYYLNLRTL